MALLRVSHLTKRFDGLKANSDINLEIPEGSLFAVIGPNGAGKTTFFSMISGFLSRRKERSNSPASISHTCARTRSPRWVWCARSNSCSSSRA